jgi:hypothetical protein
MFHVNFRAVHSRKEDHTQTRQKIGKAGKKRKRKKKKKKKRTTAEEQQQEQAQQQPNTLKPRKDTHRHAHRLFLLLLLLLGKSECNQQNQQNNLHSKQLSNLSEKTKIFLRPNSPHSSKNDKANCPPQQESQLMITSSI